jgi:hypothetical protein
MLQGIEEVEIRGRGNDDRDYTMIATTTTRRRITDAE